MDKVGRYAHTWVNRPASGIKQLMEREKIKTKYRPILEALTLILVGLKLFGIINISWWWVLSPVWVPVSVVIIILLIIVIGSTIVYVKRREDSAKDPTACRRAGPVIIHRVSSSGASDDQDQEKKAR